MPSCGNSNAWLSKAHSEPDGRFPPFSDVNHWASRTFTTNQPSPAGARPEPESSSGASRTARVYGCFSGLQPHAGDLDTGRNPPETRQRSGGKEVIKNRLVHSRVATASTAEGERG